MERKKERRRERKESGKRRSRRWPLCGHSGYVDDLSLSLSIFLLSSQVSNEQKSGYLHQSEVFRRKEKKAQRCKGEEQNVGRVRRKVWTEEVKGSKNATIEWSA